MLWNILHIHMTMGGWQQDSSLETVFQTKVAKLAPYFSNYVTKPKLEIRVSFAAKQVKLSYLIKMRSKPVSLKVRVTTY